MGSKSHLIIGQKSGENTRYYTCVLRKKIDFCGFGCGILCICDTFWIQNHTRYHSKELNNARWGGLEQLWHLLNSTSRLIVGQISWSEDGSVLSICGTFWDQIYNWLLAKKTRKMIKGGEGVLRICNTSGFKISQKSQKNARYYRRLVRKKWQLLNSKAHLLSVKKVEGRGGWSWSFMVLFGIKFTIDYGPENSEIGGRLGNFERLR